MSIDKNKAFEADNGFIVLENSIEGPFFTGGASSPVGEDLPINTIYTQITNDGALVWRKWGANADNWVIHDGNLRKEIDSFTIPEGTESIFPRGSKITGKLKIEGSGRAL